MAPPRTVVTSSCSLLIDTTERLSWLAAAVWMQTARHHRPLALRSGTVGCIVRAEASTTVRGVPVGILLCHLAWKNWIGVATRRWKNFDDMIWSFVLTQLTNVTDGHTHRHCMMAKAALDATKMKQTAAFYNKILNNSKLGRIHGYWSYIVVVYNNLLVTLVTQKIVVDRPL